MTIDDLARMVQNGFTSVDKRFDGVNKRFDTMEKTIATKAELAAFQLEVKEEFVLANEQIRSLNFAVEINDLRSRMRRVEQKLSL